MDPARDALHDPHTPRELREGVRLGIVESLRHDVDQRGGRTARLLVSAGLIGVAGAVGAVSMISGHPFGHHPPWHVTIFASVWAGLLVVSLSIVFLQVRTPSLPLAHAARVGILGLGLAGLCSVACPDPHFLHWWSATTVGTELIRLGGPGLSALCFGAVTALFLGVVAALLVLGGPGGTGIRPLLPAAMLALLLSPGVALQSVDAPWGVLLLWLLGIGLGSHLGVAGALRLRARFGAL